MRILVIPEDFRNDQYILKPLVKRLFADMGLQRAHVRICQNPRLGGVGEALKSERIQEIVERYKGMTDIFILCVDRDGIRGRRQRLDHIESEFGNDRKFLAVNAWEEVETWVLAGVTIARHWRWQDVRNEVEVKERYFEELASQCGATDSPGGGRKALAEEAARNVAAIRQKCPEDFGCLDRRLKETLLILELSS